MVRENRSAASEKNDADRAKLAEQAQKEVRFDSSDLNIDEDNQPQSQLRKAVDDARRISTRESILTVDPSDDPDFFEIFDFTDSDTRTSFLKNFQRMREDTEAWEVLKSSSTKGLDEDFLSRLNDLAAAWTNKDGPGFLYNPLTKDAKSKFPDGKVVTQTLFEDLFRDDPGLIFREMKCHVISLAVKNLQLEDLRSLTEHQFNSVKNLRAWVDNIDQLITTDEERMKSMEDELMTQVEMRDAELAKVKEQLQEANQTIGDLIRAQQENTSGVRGQKKSGKVDVPTFYHSDKDTVSFEVWFRKQEVRLEVNADWFDSDRAKMADIESHLEGEAAADLEPYLRDKHPDQIKTSADLMKYLWNEYHDPNADRKARQAFADLEMSNDLKKFQVFKNTFVRLAGTRLLPKALWKEEFHDKLISRLQNTTASEYLNPDVSFDDYARFCNQVVLNMLMADDKRKKTNGTSTMNDPKKLTTATPGGNRQGQSGNFTGSRSSTTRTSAPTTADSTTRTYPRPSREEMAKLMKEGRCFNCRQTGHTSRDCLLPSHDEAQKAAKEAQLAEVYAKYGAKNDTSGNDEGQRVEGKN